MKHAPVRLLQIAAMLILLITAAHAQTATNPFAGYWKLNVTRSTIAGNTPEGYFNYRQYEEKPGGWIAHTMIQGFTKAADILFTVAKYDGNEYPVYTSASLGTFLANGTKSDRTVAFKRVDDHTIEYTDRTNGKITSHGPCTISTDGKTLTITSRAVDATGKERAASTMVYERQTN